MSLSRFLILIPKFRGKNRIIRTLFAKFIHNTRDISMVARSGCKFTIPNLEETVGFELFSNGVYESESIDIISQMLPAGGQLIDIGGNIGAITVLIARERPDIRVLSIEASPRVFAYLQANVNQNQLGNVRVLNLAMYDQDGLELPFYSPEDQFGKGSLSPVFTKDGHMVRTITLDTLAENEGFANVAVIKVDVEGFEYLVFKGGTKLLQKPDAPAIYFEFADWAEKVAGFSAGDAQRILVSYGYQLYKEVNGKFNGPLEPMDVGNCNLFASKKPVQVKP